MRLTGDGEMGKVGGETPHLFKAPKKVGGLGGFLEDF